MLNPEKDLLYGNRWSPSKLLLVWVQNAQAHGAGGINIGMEKNRFKNAYRLEKKRVVTFWWQRRVVVWEVQHALVLAVLPYCLRIQCKAEPILLSFPE